MAPPNPISIYILTFNLARRLPSPPALSASITATLPSPPPDLLVLSLQELAPLGYAFMGGRYLHAYLQTIRDVVRMATVGVEGGDDVDDGVEGEGEGEGEAEDQRGGYVEVVSRNVGMTAIMVFRRRGCGEGWVRGLQTGGIGCGVWGMGNKGAVGVRMAVGPGEGPEIADHEEEEEGTVLTFVAAHLAPMEENSERRKTDWKDIVEGMVFERLGPSGVKDGAVPTRAEDDDQTPLLASSPANNADNGTETGIYTLPSTTLFVAGDLNYRTSAHPPTTPADRARFPQPTPSTTSATHFSQLLPHDQLAPLLRSNATLHSLREAPVAFPPTYKLRPEKSASTPTPTRWNWAPHRFPSWCDRVLYRGPAAGGEGVRVGTYDALPQIDSSDHRPVYLTVSVPFGPVPDLLPVTDEEGHGVELTPYAIRADWRARRAAARRWERVVGSVAYVFWTWEGNGMLLMVMVGAVAGHLVSSFLFGPPGGSQGA